LSGIFAHMRFILTISALALLAACATTAPETAAPTRTDAPVSAESSSRVVQILEAAGRANAPSRRDVERVLGEPDIARQEGAGAAWTYRLESCALMLLFAADSRNELRLAEAAPSARRAGAQAPNLQQCAAEVAARRS